MSQTTTDPATTSSDISSISDKKVFLHVGLHKTGSTSLQNHLFSELDANTFAYNPGGREVLNKLIIPIIRHRHTTQTKPMEAKITAFTEYIQEQILPVRQNNVLLSHECLSGEPQSRKSNVEILVQTCKAWFPNAHIIIMLRNQADWLVSIYAQRAKVEFLQWIREDKPFLTLHQSLRYHDGKFQEHSSHPDLEDESMNALGFAYQDKVRIYQELFGNERVHVLFFEHFKQNPAAFIQQLADILGVKLTYKSLPKTNQALNESQISTRRLICNLPLPVRARRMIASLYMKFLENKLSQDKLALDSSLRRQLFEYYQEHNAWLEPYFPNDEVRSYYL